MTTLIDGLVERPALRSRNTVGYLTARSWRVGERKAQIAAMKADKALPAPTLVPPAAAEVAAFLGKYVPLTDAIITSVPCGHSRRPDCFGKRLAQETARIAGLPFLQLWADRPCKGVSHPKEFIHLPALEWENIPDRLTIIVDDVATSGWHLEEAVLALRGRGIPALALAWIGGSVGEGRDSRQSQANGSSDGDEDRPLSPFAKRGRVWRMPGR